MKQMTGRYIVIRDEHSKLFGHRFLNSQLSLYIGSIQLLVCIWALAQHVWSIFTFGKILHCDFSANSTLPPFLTHVDAIIFDIGLFHHFWGITGCVAQHLDGGYGRFCWCIAHTTALLLCLPFAFVSRPKPHWLWPLLIQQSAYGVGMLILSLAALPKAAHILGDLQNAPIKAIVFYALGTLLNFFLLYVYWHWYWHVESLWNSARKLRRGETICQSQRRPFRRPNPVADQQPPQQQQQHATLLLLTNHHQTSNELGANGTPNMLPIFSANDSNSSSIDGTEQSNGYLLHTAEKKQLISSMPSSIVDGNNHHHSSTIITTTMPITKIDQRLSTTTFSELIDGDDERKSLSTMGKQMSPERANKHGMEWNGIASPNNNSRRSPPISLALANGHAIRASSQKEQQKQQQKFRKSHEMLLEEYNVDSETDSCYFQRQRHPLHSHQQQRSKHAAAASKLRNANNEQKRRQQQQQRTRRRCSLEDDPNLSSSNTSAASTATTNATATNTAALPACRTSTDASAVVVVVVASPTSLRHSPAEHQRKQRYSPPSPPPPAPPPTVAQLAIGKAAPFPLPPPQPPQSDVHCQHHNQQTVLGIRHSMPLSSMPRQTNTITPPSPPHLSPQQKQSQQHQYHQCRRPLSLRQHRDRRQIVSVLQRQHKEWPPQQPAKDSQQELSHHQWDTHQ